MKRRSPAVGALEGAPAWHRLRVAEVAEVLDTDPERGLDPGAAAERLARHGPNELAAARPPTLLRTFLGQLNDFMILVLIAAAAVSGAVGEGIDAVAIVVIVVLNAVVGTAQERRAERAIAALRSLAARGARVLRTGHLHSVAAREVVPGDVVELEAGDVVPADLRLTQVFDLEVDESALTGESLSVGKQTGVLVADDLSLGDRRNLVYRGTLVTRGRARGLAVATGMQSELGRIAALLGESPRARTPLQRRLARFGRRLAVAVLLLCGLLLGIGLLRGEPPLLMFMTAVSLAVAAIPEALPAVVTVALALGARGLSRRRALIRRLPAVETLGSVTTICADKTGTLTQNRMQLAEVIVEGDAPRDSAPWPRLWHALALCNDVTLSGPADDASKEPLGEPTEVALAQAAREAGFERDACLRSLPRVGEVPFHADRKRMSTLHREGERVRVFTKGAPEAVLARCARSARGEEVDELDAATWLARAEALAGQGLRVLAVATRELPALPEDVGEASVEFDLTLLGLVGLLDPPRESAEQAVRDCLSAGIAPVMITGDHPGTALAIAQRVGIACEGALVMCGTDLAQLSEEELAERIEDVRVYARVDPEQKTVIVSALQARGQLVAMTGDGVNDAPALKRADIGVAMGLRGTDVAREAADMVLLDDDFATIVAAVREGRRIFDDIRKFIKYTLTSNAGELWTLLLAPLLGLPIPLLPIQILWINLVTDGLPGLALSNEPAEPGVMQRPPRPPRESFFAGGLWQHVLWVGLLIGGLSIGAQVWALEQESSHWRTLVFTVLTFSQLVHAMVIRSEREPLWRRGLRSNPALLGAVLLTVGLQLAVIYVPLLQPVFRTQALPAQELALCFGLAAVVGVGVELEKALARRGWIQRDNVVLRSARG